MEGIVNVHRALNQKSQGERRTWRPRYRCVDNIKLWLEEEASEVEDMIYLNQRNKPGIFYTSLRGSEFLIYSSDCKLIK